MASRLALAAALVLASSYGLLSFFRKRGKKSLSRAGLFKGSPRLPTFAAPRSYDLQLSPDLNTFDFSGKLVVTLDVVKETSHLVLNAYDLTISKDTLWLRSNETHQVMWPTYVEVDKEDEILVLSFDRSLPLGEAILCMEYKGFLNDSMKGFYRSSYMKGGETRFMAVTQFEAADARRCFPCWDEPVFKATFKLTVTVPGDRVVLSNMPVEEESFVGSSKVVSFQESPKMSTYLVAIVVGELEYIESTTPSGTKVRVYCEAGKTEQGKFSLDVATKTLPFYEEYFGTAYPLPKLDMVAVPDFAAGAMENYGLVTFRELTLLHDEKNSAAANKQRVAIVVTHELAHQWFGNLVTMDWWTHLWLNEGFATWVSYLAVDHLFADWKVWTQFIERTVVAFKLDGLIGSHPIEVEVGHAREIDEIFDAISYNKGASVIQMLQAYLGADIFQKGLVSYIKKYAYKNASTEDLWTSLAEESGEPVKAMMDTWTKQKGYPVLSATMKDSVLELEQSQYLSSGTPGSGEWIVPITMCVGSYSAITLSLVKGKVSDVRLPTSINKIDSNFKEMHDEKVPMWVKLNVGQTGFYRVQYDEGLAAGLRSAVMSRSLNPIDRFGFLDDTYALCSACKQPLTALLSLMDVFRDETDYSVLTSLITIAFRLVLVVSDAFPEAAPDIKRFNAKLLQYAAEKLGWEVKEQDNHLDAMLRGEVLGALVSFGNEDVITEGTRRFEAFLQDRETALLPADIRSAAYNAVMKRSTCSDKSGYESLLKIYRESDLSQERSRILNKIASSPDPTLVREALDYSVSSEVRKQDTIFVWRGIGCEGRENAWLWLKENWDFVWKNWGESFIITTFITSAASQFSSNEKADEIEAFFQAHGNPAIERTVSQSVESVRITARWVKHIREEDGVLECIRELSYRC